MKKPPVGKWVLVWVHEQAFHRMQGDGWKNVRLGIIRLNKEPHPATMIERKDYSGFILNFDYWFPIRFNKNR